MKFSEVVSQTLAWLEREGRVSYRALRLEFDLNEDMLDALKEEIIEVKEAAVDKDGKMLVWTGASPVPSSEFRVPSSTQSPTPSTQPPAAERRQLTVLFCDLVDSTALSARLDPEEWREIVQAYQALGAHSIEQYEGQIAQYLGDGLLVYFGYPTAHEDDAQRAVRSGLALVEAIQQAPLLQRHGVQVRIGIHTGLVVVGEIGGGAKREQLALGDTPNIAARLQGLADPDTVVISEATYRLVPGLFAYRTLGARSLKGFSSPLAIYQVTSEQDWQSPDDLAVGRSLIPLIGREHEMGLLLDRWEQAKEGDGQMVLLSGEAGIGKSRLVQALREQAITDGAIRMEFRCSPYHQHSALYPIIEHLQRVLQFTREDTPQTKLGKLQRTIARYRFPQADTIPLLAALLSLPHPEEYPPLQLSLQRQKHKTLETLLAWVFEEAQRAPVYCVWEDLHQADLSTLELLQLQIDQTAATQMLTVMTFRPEFVPPWGARSYLSQVTLNRLGRAQIRRMVESVAKGKAFPAEVLQQIVHKTDGVPLFVEELTKMVLESGLLRETEGRYELNGPLPALAIPSTLQDSLMARLDRLASAREIAQVGATLGREFSYELLQAVAERDEGDLQQGLAQLVTAELLYQRGTPPHATYLFKHALVRDTAYQSLLKSRRQKLHQQVAQVLETRFTETTATQPELVAQHYTEATLVGQALPYWQRAGQRATERSANAEAVQHLTTALDLLKTLPDTPERAQQELTLQVTLGPVLIATKGYTAPEVNQTYTRARELCRQVGETPHLFPVMFGLRTVFHVRGQLQAARELGEQLLSLAQNARDPDLLLEANRALGSTTSYQGEFIVARAHYEQSMTLYDPQRHRAHAFVYGQDPGVVCLAYGAVTLWLLGYADQAVSKSHEALTLAREVAHPFSLAFALFHSAIVHQLRREGQRTHQHVEALLALAREQAFPIWLAWRAIPQAWVLAEQGRGGEAIEQLRQGLTAAQAIGAGLWKPYLLSVLGYEYGKMGQTEEGLSTLSEALTLIDQTGERWGEAELYRIKGELLLAQSKTSLGQVSGQSQTSQEKSEDPNTQSEAEACFLKAIAIAQKQQAKSLELRAVMSVAWLWQSQGKTAAARQILTAIYSWFTEGFETKDLQEAKALLEALA